MKKLLFIFLLLPFIGLAQSPKAPPVVIPIPVGGGGSGMSPIERLALDSLRGAAINFVTKDSGYSLYPNADAARLSLLEQRAIFDPSQVYNKTSKVPSEDITGGVIDTRMVSRAFTSPTTTNTHLIYTPIDIIVSAVRDAVVGSSPSVTYSIKYGSLRSTAVGTIVNARTTTSTTGAAATLTNTTVPIPAGSWIWIEITATSGTINDFGLTLIYN